MADIALRPQRCQCGTDRRQRTVIKAGVEIFVSEGYLSQITAPECLMISSPGLRESSFSCGS